MTGRAVMGGVELRRLASDSPDEAINQLRQAWEQTKGLRWIAGASDELSTNSPGSTLEAIREGVERLR